MLDSKSSNLLLTNHIENGILPVVWAGLSLFLYVAMLRTEGCDGRHSRSRCQPVVYFM